jgi:methyl-accepting chemotaxis protein
MTAETARPKFRRLRYFVSAKYQLKYIGTILLFMFLAVAVSTYTVYFTGMTIFAEKLSNVYPQARVVPLLNMVNYRILLNILFLIPIVAFISMYLSHKIAGPIYRLERYLTDMAAGQLMVHVKLRKGDEFGSLAAKINNVTDSLRAAFVNQKTSMTKIVSELDEVKKLTDSKGASIAEIDSKIDKINGEIKALGRELDKFKV